MAGQRIDREARYAQTGLTEVQRNKLILDWHNAGFSFQAIGDKLKMSKSAVKYAYDAANGIRRQQKQASACHGCNDPFYTNQLVNGLCPDCRKGGD